ncbi:MAG: hypothetical protein O7G85_08870 [Planctomycetota bacterium]|nr:hypothetical protein [Planctomycetota bacterium]
MNISNNTWANTTLLHPLGLAALVVLGFAMLLLPRRYAIVPMIIMACFLGPAQRIVVLTLDFNLLRVMVLFGWMRILLRGETSEFHWKAIDGLVFAWALSGLVAMTLLHGTIETLIYKLGFVFDAAGMYFLFRVLIRDWNDIDAIATSVVVISLPVAIAFLIEKSTGRNSFAIFGGVPDYTLIRKGVLRCQGAFAHPILAGAFWAALMPIVAALWFRTDWRRVLAPVGIICSLIIIFTCGSTTPPAAAAVGVAAMMLYPVRGHLVWIRWCTLAGLFLMHIAMTMPVWHLLTRIDLTKGSNGWYRYKLIDDFITHFNEWWMVGTKSTSHWWAWGTNDVTNQYVLEGVTGGLLTLVLFLITIAWAFRGVGRFENQIGRSTARRVMAWSLGVSLFIHCVIFIGVSYFGQSMLLWYLTLAMIGSLSPSSASTTSRIVLRGREAAPENQKRVTFRDLPRPALPAGDISVQPGG